MLLEDVKVLGFLDTTLMPQLCLGEGTQHAILHHHHDTGSLGKHRHTEQVQHGSLSLGCLPGHAGFQHLREGRKRERVLERWTCAVPDTGTQVDKSEGLA